jgi:hypothetical protein
MTLARAKPSLPRADILRGVNEALLAEPRRHLPFRPKIVDCVGVEQP